MSWVKSLKYLMDGIILAFQFLTTVPVKKQVPWDSQRASMSLVAFPIVGLVLGFLLSVVVYSLSHFSSVSTVIIVFLVLFLSVIYSGALHLDGWMDVSDAVLSHRDQNKKLEIMKDPRVGAFAVISIIFLLGWRLLLMYETIQLTDMIWIYVFIIPFLSRWLMGWSLLFGKPARKEGLAYMYQPYINNTVKVAYVIWLVLMSLIVSLVFSDLLITWFIILIIFFIYFWISKKFFYKQFGGVTGDTIGATGEGGETLLWLILFLLHYFAMV